MKGEQEDSGIGVATRKADEKDADAVLYQTV
jgi:hypothetical protein